MKFTGCVAAIVLLAVLGVSAPASAKMSKLKGQVIGQPYAAKKGTLVPVLLDKRSGKRARLRSSVGAMRVAAKRVKAPGRTRIPTHLLRIGDVVQVRTKVRRAARRSGYWQLKARKLTVKRRSATLSPAELQEIVAQLQGDVTELRQIVIALATQTAEEFSAVRADLASLRADLNALQNDFATLAAQLQSLEDQFDDVLQEIAALKAAATSLGNQLAALQAQVTTLAAQLATLDGAVGDLSGLLTGVAPGDIAGMLTDIGTLQSDLAALQSNVGVLCGPTSPLNALC